MQGGVIDLYDVTAVDYEFLGLDPLNPPPHRDENQDAEDAFCQRLLLLGAKWWDSEERYLFVTRLEEAAHGRVGAEYGHGDMSFRNVTRPAATMREKRWVKVGWPSTGGLWVSEFDTTWAGVDEEENLPPKEGLGRVNLARTMDQRCQILKDVFRGKFYAHLDEYEGFAFLKAWKWKTTGEVSRLLTPEQTTQEWIASFRRRDAKVIEEV